ncbi:hypothetical protein SYNPS1DRAFT_20258, partial [Syncephalis pseudoplumigaleata]
MVSLIRSALLLAAVASVALVGQASAECETIYVRREVRDLADEEWRVFVEAVQKVMKTEKPQEADGQAMTIYDDLVKQHLDYQDKCHGTPIFLPWHRAFLKTFELELQKAVPGVVAPYWHWGFDSQAPHHSEVLSHKYYGGAGQGEQSCVPDTPFKDYKPTYTADGMPKCICRQYDDNGNRIAPFSPIEELASIVENSPDFDDFSSRIEGNPHGLVHNGIGYGFSSMSSPSDPIFFAHHAFVDMLWAKFQERE